MWYMEVCLTENFFLMSKHLLGLCYVVAKVCLVVARLFWMVARLFWMVARCFLTGPSEQSTCTLMML